MDYIIPVSGSNEGEMNVGYNVCESWRGYKPHEIYVLYKFVIWGE